MAKIRRSPQTALVLREFLGAAREWRYGYDLSRGTGLKSGTLYPILMRLSERGWMETMWEDAAEAGRPPRHLYRLTADGVRWAREQVAGSAEASSRTPALVGMEA